ncbi:hypothetical protein FH972_021781 [Carpinus fangiana]|uniref:STB6-like N-terminal domain-containing protein n=1 Tax=Carpinus fangiana TaxID=176857 RepID=A0A5N6KQN9_9ROSI|nr:hypothetical protein FH972_021781 [Carpinus fangiana]
MNSRPQSSEGTASFRRLPRLQTNHSVRTSHDTLSTAHSSTRDHAWAALHSAKPLPAHGPHQRIVLADPVAFLYLEEDTSTIVLERSRQLQGYQIYVVEQWACSRSHPTFVILTYTGDESHSVKVGVLGVPADENAWSPRLKVYFRVLSDYHARRRDTPLGYCMTTNLSGVPSSLNLILVPDGDLRKHKEAFVVNENLKRLGCSGRVGLTLAEPNAATRAKFHQLYRTSDKIALDGSVIELVKLCQAALMLYDYLESEYVDGLLCDVTEKAISDWWVEVGTELYNVEPGDGVLGPTTVAALLGTLMGARNRLHAFGAPVTKDCFDVESTKRGIAHFQKSQRLRKTRRLDRQTLLMLQKATVKQASGEGWTVPRAVKSTVAELSGKGGEMVMEMVGRDKTRIADVETVDFDAFLQLLGGEHAKWLWRGKARKRHTRDLFNDNPRDIASAVTESRTSYDGDDKTKRPSYDSIREEDEDQLGRARSSTIQTQDSVSRQSVLGRTKDRLKGAVGRGHSSTRSKDRNAPLSASRSSVDGRESLDIPGVSAKDFIQESGDFDVPEQVEEQPDAEEEAEARDGFESRKPSLPKSSNGNGEPQIESNSAFPSGNESNGQLQLAAPFDLDGKLERVISNRSASQIPDDTSDLPPGFPCDDRPGQRVGPLLRESLSSSALATRRVCDSEDGNARWPTRLSFSAAEDAVLHRPQLDTAAGVDSPIRRQSTSITQPGQHQTIPLSPRQQLKTELLAADHARRLRASIAAVGARNGAWLQYRVRHVSELDDLVASDLEQLQSLLYPRRQETLELADAAREVVGEERGRLAEALRDVETQGAKLEYELGNLRGKVEDLEGAVDEFERQSGLCASASAS